MNKQITNDQSSCESPHRRSFLKAAGVATVTTALIITGCSDDDDNVKPKSDGVDLGSGDTGILNYAYALEQLEAAFYIAFVGQSGFATQFSEEEQMVLKDVRDHEISHRDFFKTALGSKAIGALEADFSSIDFGNRTKVLAAAKTFEDLGVAAYNGAGMLLSDPNLLLVAGKIVSVEARHAAAIRDLINPLSSDFSGDDVVNNNGFDKAMTPAEVLAAAAPFIKTKIDASNLPTS